MAEQHSFLAKIEGSELQGYIKGVRAHAGELTLEVSSTDIIAALTLLKNSYGFSYLADMTGIDHYEDSQRFEVAYNLVCLSPAQRLRVSTRVEEETPALSSATEVFAAANWYERELFDMVGIRFEGHPDMRRMYMPEDFEWYPMRKEFPQLGIPGSIPLPEKDPPKPYK